MKVTRRQLRRIIKEEMNRLTEIRDERSPAGVDPDENRQLVMDYLFNLPENELIQIAAEYLGEDAAGLNYDYALKWVEGMSTGESEDVAYEMGV